MESGSAITRSLRSRISRERGPGMAVLSSIAFVVAMALTIAQPAAALHTCIGDLQPLAERGRGERLDRVEAGGVPQHEALGVLESRCLDLVLDISERVGAAQGEVLQPRDQLGLVSSHGLAEVAQRVGHRRARAG